MPAGTLSMVNFPSASEADPSREFWIRIFANGTGSPLEISSTTVQIKDGSFDFNVASHDGTNGLKLGGTLVTASATELNYTDISSLGSIEKREEK